MLKTKSTQLLLGAIEQEPRYTISKENLFDNPTRLYLMIKSIYQHYKKQNILQLMQQRIFQIKAHNTDQTIQLTKVSAYSLFTFHRLMEDDLILLIKMKDFIKSQMRSQLQFYILKGIDKLQRIEEIMRCYKILLNLQFLKNDMIAYKLIEDRMVNKLINTQLQNKDFSFIAKYILALPKIGQQIIILISKLYQKVQHISQFNALYLIFKHNFPNKQETQLTVNHLEAIVRISLPQTLHIIIEMVEAKDEYSNKILDIAQAQAKYKLSTMEYIMTDKTKHILNFIIQVIKFGRPIWHQIIQWQHKATQQPKNLLKDNLQGILIQILSDNSKYRTVIGIIQRISQIQQHSQIGLIFVRQLLRLQQKRYLNNRTIRRFLALKILKYNSSQQYVQHIFSVGFKFIEVILEMFNFQSNVLNFYIHLINNQESTKILEHFLKNLSEQMPNKYKEFYLKCYSVDKSQKDSPFTNIINVLLRILNQNINIDLAINIVRDIALIQPTKYLLIILGKFLFTFKQSKQISILKNQIIRALNIIIISTPKQQLSYTIKISLPLFLKQNFRSESSKIFENVGQQTNLYLKKVYQQYLSRKRI